MVIVAVCVGYALGCLSPGWWIVRRTTGADLRATGSGRTGATNAGRLLGARGFALVLLLDAAKAAAAVLVSRWLMPHEPWHVLALPAAVAGHVWPVQLRFSGGRGAGPLLGGCMAMNPWFALVAGMSACAAALFTRRSFALTGAATAGGIAAAPWLLGSVPERVAFVLSVALVILAHWSRFQHAFRRSAP